MPTINKPQKKSKNDRKQTINREIRQKAYNNTEWKKLRAIYIKEHPICEECLKQGKVTAAEDVHHIKSPFQNGEVNHNLLLDKNNLMSLCKLCHNKKHNPNQGPTVQDVLRQLSDLLDENKPDSDFE